MGKVTPDDSKAPISGALPWGRALPSKSLVTNALTAEDPLSLVGLPEVTRKLYTGALVNSGLPVCGLVSNAGAAPRPYHRLLDELNVGGSPPLVYGEGSDDILTFSATTLFLSAIEPAAWK